MSTGRKGGPINGDDRDMNYAQIKTRIEEVTTSLKLLPGRVVKDILPEGWSLPDVHDSGISAVYTHPRITCVIHNHGQIVANYTEDVQPYSVCTIEVDGIAAFFFIRMEQGRSWGKGIHCSHYVLDIDITREFLRILMGVALDRIPLDSYRLRQAVQVEEIPELIKYDGEEIPWGSIYNRDGNIQWADRLE